MSHPRLVTPQGIAAFLGREIDDNDFLANLMSSMASQLVRSYLGQLVHFVDNDVVKLDGTGESRGLILPEMPVVRVNEVITHDISLGDPVTLDPTTYVVDDAGIVWRVDGGFFPWGHMNITVDYDHGWDVGVDTGSVVVEDNPVDHVPADILLVALRIAARGFLAGTSLQGGGSSIKASESISTESYSYTNVASDAAVRAATSSAQELAPDEVFILDHWKLQRVA